MYETSVNKLTEYRSATEAVKTPHTDSSVSKICRSSLIYLEAGDSTFLQNISKHITVCVASPWAKFSQNFHFNHAVPSQWIAQCSNCKHLYIVLHLLLALFHLVYPEDASCNVYQSSGTAFTHDN
jgi:hypothetical protein